MDLATVKKIFDALDAAKPMPEQEREVLDRVLEQMNQQSPHGTVFSYDRLHGKVGITSKYKIKEENG